MRNVKPRVDLTGKTFGKLTVIKRVDPIVKPNGRKVQQWLCQCSCGKQCVARHGNLTSGTTTSCGCTKRELSSKRKLEDLCGKRFGELYVIRRASEIGGKRVKWLCSCSCGRLTIAEGANLKQGNTTSCGCMKNSKAESIIVHILNQYHISYVKEKKFSDLLSEKGNPLRFDFCIYTDTGFFLLEYHGIQHYKVQADGFGQYEREYSDAEKLKYCHKNNIELAIIPYNVPLYDTLINILKAHNLLHDNTVPSSDDSEKV